MQRVQVLVAGTGEQAGLLGDRVRAALAQQGIQADVCYEPPIEDRFFFDECAEFPPGFLDRIAAAESGQGTWTQPRGAGKSRLPELFAIADRWNRLARTGAGQAPRERRTAQWKREVRRQY